MRIAKGVLVAALFALLTSAAQGQTTRPTPKRTPLPNDPPTVKLKPSTDRVTLAPGCDEATRVSPSCQATSPRVTLSAQVTDPDGDTILYTYTTTGGVLVGDGPEVTLDLTGVLPGTYTVTVEVDDGNGGVTTDAVKILVERCTCPLRTGDPPRCPTVTVSCYDQTGLGPPIKFKASLVGGDPGLTPTVKWSVPGFRILSGEETWEMTIEPPAHGGTVVATVEVGGGYDRSCPLRASCTTHLIVEALPRKLDEYGDIPVGDEKRRLDDLNEGLQNDPTAQGYILCYGGRRSRADDAQRRCDRARNFLLVSRGVDAPRVVTVDGGYREKPAIELWLVPSGVTPPQANPTVDPKEVRPPRAPRRPRRGARR